MGNYDKSARYQICSNKRFGEDTVPSTYAKSGALRIKKTHFVNKFSDATIVQQKINIKK